MAFVFVPGSQPVLIRPATTADHDAVLALNAESVAVLSPLDAQRLSHLHDQSAAFWVAPGQDDAPSRLAGFMLVMREGVDYDSPNYRWFAQALPSFLYVDRVVVGSAARGSGLGQRFYERLFALAAEAGVATVACEIDIDPPNDGSARFHERLGFREVGRQAVMNGKKIVSLQTVTLA